MSRNARIAIVLAALAGLIVAFVIASGSDDNETSPQADDPPATQAAPAGTTQAETEAADPGGTTAPPAETTAEPEPEPEPEPPLVRVEGGQPVGGVQELEFDSGDRVRFRVRADAADEIHVHGYDVTKQLTPGTTATVSFDGELEGVFEVELHGAGTQIAELKVSP